MASTGSFLQYDIIELALREEYFELYSSARWLRPLGYVYIPQNPKINVQRPHARATHSSRLRLVLEVYLPILFVGHFMYMQDAF